MKFQRIYAEETSSEIAQRLVAASGDVPVVSIDHYASVLNRSRADHLLQKQYPSLVIARRPAHLVNTFSQFCQKGQFSNAVYVTPAINCPFHCDYCFLAGKYNSAYLVVFTDIEACQQALLKTAAERADSSRPLFVSLSYESDIVPLEPKLGIVESYANFAATNDSMFFECRTKSGAFTHLQHIDAPTNMLLSFTLSPQAVIDAYENTPSLVRRLNAAYDAVEAGWSVRLCFDPIIPLVDNQRVYSHFFKQVFQRVPGERLFDVTIGPFRMAAAHLKQAKSRRPDCFRRLQSVQPFPHTLPPYIIEMLHTYLPAEKILKIGD